MVHLKEAVRELPWFSQSSGSCTLDVKKYYREDFPPKFSFVGAHMAAECLGMQWRANPDWSCSGEQMEVPVLNQLMKRSKSKKGFIGWLELLTQNHWIPPGFATSQSDECGIHIF